MAFYYSALYYVNTDHKIKTSAPRKGYISLVFYFLFHITGTFLLHRMEKDYTYTPRSLTQCLCQGYMPLVENGESPEDSCHVENHVSQKGPGGHSERLHQSHAASHNGGHKYPSTYSTRLELLWIVKEVTTVYTAVSQP